MRHHHRGSGREPSLAAIFVQGKAIGAAPVHAVRHAYDFGLWPARTVHTANSSCGVSSQDKNLRLDRFNSEARQSGLSPPGGSEEMLTTEPRR